jgi:hypothetical protein
MILPDDVIALIKEYSMPITSPDWRQGCYYKRQLSYNTNYENYIAYLVLISFRFQPWQLQMYVNHMYD